MYLAHRLLKTGVVFTQTAQGVTSVTVNPSTATLSRGGQVKLSATVVTTGFANKAVTWSSSYEKVTVNQEGLVTVASDATTGNVTITATSVYDNTVTGTATITVA